MGGVPDTVRRHRFPPGDRPGPAWRRAARSEESIVTNRTYRVTEIVGTSTESIDAAIRNGVHRAAQTLRHVDWFEVTEIRGHLVDAEIDHIQVGMKIGFRLEDPE
jgi:flavin-binding protein dodecin